jgi:HEAT repeat protein
VFFKPNVEEMERKGDVRGLAKALNGKDFRIQDRAAEALTRMGKAAVEPLLEILSGGNSYARFKAVRALGKIKDARATEPLAKIAEGGIAQDDAHKSVQWEAALALARLGDARAAKQVIHLMRSTGRIEREIQHERSRSPLYTGFEIPEEVARAFIEAGKSSVPSLCQALRDGDHTNRLIALRLLSRLGDVCAVEPVVQSLEDKTENASENIFYVLEVISTLGRLGEPAVEPLINIMREERVRGRVVPVTHAIATLGRMGDVRAADSLIEVITDKEAQERYRREAVAALAKLEDGRVVGLLTKILRDRNERIRDAAAVALGDTGDARAVEPLIEALDEHGSSVGRSAVVALGNMREQRAFEPLLSIMRERPQRFEWAHEVAAIALGRIGDVRAAETVIDWLFTRKPQHEWPSYLFQTDDMVGLFGGYAGFILNASVSPHEKENDEAVRVLCDVKTRISSNILHKVALKNDTDLYGSMERLRFATMLRPRSLTIMAAKEELRRRGNPPYDPSAYLEKEAWNAIDRYGNRESGALANL